MRRVLWGPGAGWAAGARRSARTIACAAAHADAAGFPPLCATPQHYLATLLSGVLGLKEELSCVGIGPTHQDWDNGRADFYEYL